ncbi:MAG: antibiotic biosynthesis monooxygenase [Acidobacteria bacterium]|nr:antibiotic biosynthesis monooxygenase [Acidobacteriota bacterium]
MFLRFVRLRLKPGKLWTFRDFYERRILTALQETAGCLFAGLLEPSDASGNECTSMTLWESEEEADAYEASGLYDVLLDESDVYLADVTEWRTDLTGLRVGARPPLPDPEVEAFPVRVARLPAGEVPMPAGHLYLRIVELRVDPVRFEDLKRRYSEFVLPGLFQTPGCRAVFLVEAPRGQCQALSVTLWDSEEDAIRFENGGGFDELTAHVRDFLSGLYQWKLSLAPAGDTRQVTGRDLGKTGYQILIGKRLRG